MKTLRFALYLLMLSVFAACSSGSDDSSEPTPPQPDKPTVTFPAGTDTAPVVAQTGGTSTLNFTATQSWSASVKAASRSLDWISVSPTSGGAGNVTLKITTQPNDTPDERNAAITISSGGQAKTVTVSQKQKNALTVTSNKVELKAEGGNFTIEAKANVSVSYEIGADAKEWIKSSSSRGLTTTNLSFTAEANGSKEKRQGTILIKGDGGLSETVTVYQAGEGPTIVLTKNEYTVSCAGETITVELQSNVDVEVQKPASDWITQSTGRALSTHTYYFDIAPNEGYDNRTDSIFFVNKENGIKEKVVITQVQENAIIVAQNEYSVLAAGGALDFAVNTNVDFSVSVSVDWIKQVESRALTEKPLYFDIAENTLEEAREGKITITDGEIVQEIVVKQAGKANVEEQMREALIAFYKATDGDNWTDNTNWCSDKPITEWYGITEPWDRKGCYFVDLSNNNLTANLDDCLKYFYALPIASLDLVSNNITGSIPQDIDKLVNVQFLSLGQNDISGEIPKGMCNMESLESLHLALSNISGEIPRDIGKLKNLRDLTLANTNLSGTIPESICELINLSYLNISETDPGIVGGITGKIPEDIGNLINLTELYLGQNQLTGNLPVSMSKLIKCTSCVLHGNKLDGHIPSEVSNSPMFTNWITTIMEQQEGYELTFDAPYTSTDFSKDKEVIIMHKHTQGNGIPIILMGDAYVDKDMEEGGLYETVMKKAMEAFFSKEPIKSLRDYFDVYCVKAVSTENYMGGNTALGTYFDGHTDLGGDYEKCFAYARLVREDLSNVPIIVLLNRDRLFINVCHLLTDRTSVSFIPANQNYFEETISHETVGHGFSYLGDEYWMHIEEPMTEEQKQQFKKEQDETGWALNIDVTDDPELVRWSSFIKDTRYNNEKIGIYEGGLGSYMKGVYRPTEWSLMNAAEPGQEFNAPSREIIYKRVMQLAYGDSWTYDYETFVKWDMEHYPTELQGRSVSSFNNTEWMKNHRPPVRINRTSAEILRQGKTVVPFR